MAETPYLIDSNILLRWVKPDHSDYPVIVSALDAILQREGVLCYTSQNVAEFWNACTRPKLLVSRGVSGVQVHDARLVAAMRVHGVKRILTFNDKDFVRYADIEAVHPRAIR